MKKLLTTALLTMSFIACDESGDSGEQKPMLSFIRKDSSALTGVYVNSSDYEFGPRLRFRKAGQITALGIQMPDSSSYVVTLWDMTDTSVVRSIEIAADSGEIKYVPILPVDVAENAEYSVTIQSNDWYEYANVEDDPFYIPDVVGDVEIVNYAYFEGSTQTFPDEVYYYYYAGLQDVIFLPNPD